MFFGSDEIRFRVYNGIESIEANFYIALNISDYVKKKKKKLSESSVFPVFR